MKTNILFLCTGNSCRSQMAERVTRKVILLTPDGLVFIPLKGGLKIVRLQYEAFHPNYRA